MRWQDQFKRFFSVGFVGFTIDGALLWILVTLDLGAVNSRIIALVVAVTVTWWLNRQWSFASTNANKVTEYVRYFTVQFFGACLNVSAYVALIEAFPELRQWLIVPFCVGGIIGMVFNFCCLRWWVFAR